VSEARPPAGERPARRIALLGFLPEAGHLAPLVRIARAATDAGHEARCFLADAGRPLAERFGADAAYADVRRPEGAASRLRALIEARGSLREIAARRAYADAYMVPLMAELARRFDALAAPVRAFAPDLVVSDAHALGWLYRRIVPGATHGEHVAAGTHFHGQSARVRRAGLGAGVGASLRARAAGWVEAVTPRAQRLLDRERWRRSIRARDVMAELRSAVTARPAARSAARFATGLGVLERAHLSELVAPCPDTTFFGALDPVAGAELDPGLRAWLEEDGRPVALLSLGSMIDPRAGVAERARRGLRDAGLRVLQIGRDASTGDGGADPAGLRTEGFAPQPELLAHPKVRLFGTHAGSGATQDGIWTATPMLCLPMVSDQRYNASVVEHLGAGVRVPAGASVRDVAGAARRLLGDDALGERAAALSRELRACGGGDAVVGWLTSLAPGGAEEARS